MKQKTILQACLLGAALHTGAFAARPITDAPLPLQDTGIAVLNQVPGEFFWLDDNTLAVTTFADQDAAFAWTLRQIVAYDVRARKATTLVPKGFLTCADTAEGLVGVYLGDLQSSYVGGSRSPPPVPAFFRWDKKSRTLMNADVQYRAGWNRMGCAKTLPEDVNGMDWMMGRKPLRYLQPKDGMLTWESATTNEPLPVSLSKNGKRTPLQLTSSEIALQTPYRAFADAYQLAEGVFMNGQKPPINRPLVMMKPNGQVTRTMIPPELQQRISGKGDTGEGQMFPVAHGAQLVYMPAKFSVGRGLYLVKSDAIKRVWCIPEGREQTDVREVCRVSQKFTVSPDGCKVAFDSLGQWSKNTSQTIKVMEICTPGGKLP